MGSYNLAPRRPLMRLDCYLVASGTIDIGRTATDTEPAKLKKELTLKKGTLTLNTRDESYGSGVGHKAHGSYLP